MKIACWAFVFFYVLAASVHPEGFNPYTDFFCNLFQDFLNTSGSYGVSEIFGIAALFSISSFVGLFFVNYANYSSWNKSKKIFVKTSGVISALSMMFIFSRYHDELILISSIIGTPAVGMVLIDNLNNKNLKKSFLGLITVFLLTLYNAIFYLGFLETIWPIFQKLCIILCLIWSNQLITTLRKKAVT